MERKTALSALSVICSFSLRCFFSSFLYSLSLSCLLVCLAVWWERVDFALRGKGEGGVKRKAEYPEKHIRGNRRVSVYERGQKSGERVSW